MDMAVLLMKNGANPLIQDKQGLFNVVLLFFLLLLHLLKEIQSYTQASILFTSPPSSIFHFFVRISSQKEW